MIDTLLREASLFVYLFFLFYFFSNWQTQLVKKKSVDKIIGTIGLFLASVGSFLSDFLLKNSYLPYINLVIATIIIYSVAKIVGIPSLEAVIWTIILVVTNLICEVLSFNLLSPFFKSNVDDYMNPSFTISFVSIDLLLGLIAIILFKHLIVKKQITQLTNNAISLFFLVSVPIFSIVILFGLLMGIRAEKHYGVTDILITSSVIILNVSVFLLYRITIEHQNELYHISLSKNAIETEYKVLNEMKKNLSSVRKLKHDLKNQYLVVLGLLDSSEKEMAENYIKESLDILETPTKFYASDAILNYLLNDKMAYALENNISVNHQIFISKNLKLDGDVLAIVIGNILDNAIEASLRIDDANRLLSITMKQNGNDLFIEVSNKFNVNELETRMNRKDQGLGIKNVNRLINDMGGIYNYWSENDLYYVSIVLFNVYKN